MKKFIIFFVLSTVIFAKPIIHKVETNGRTIGQFEKIEIQLSLTAYFSNPYDPIPKNHGIDLWAIFTSPSMKKIKINGFYSGREIDTPWFVRFSTGKMGLWKFSIFVKDHSGLAQSRAYSFTIVKSLRNGFIRPSVKNPRFFIDSRGKPFYGVGNCTGWSENVINPSFEKMNEYNINLLSFWICMPWASPSGIPSRAPIENSTYGIGWYDSKPLELLDKIIEEAEQYQKLIITIWPHDLLRSRDSWRFSAYSSICFSETFFSDENSWYYQQNFYRYLIARYSYSSSILFWEIISESSMTDGYKMANGREIIDKWLQKVTQFYLHNDPFRHPITASYHGGYASENSNLIWQTGYQITGISQMHSYEFQRQPEKSVKAIIRDIRYLWNLYNQPCYIGEFGSDVDELSEIVLHNALWGSLCSGSALSPILWVDNGKYTLTKEMLKQQKYFARFILDINFVDKITEQKIVKLFAHGQVAGVGNQDFAIIWIFRQKGLMKPKTLSVSSFAKGVFHIQWYNTWEGKIVYEEKKFASNGQLILTTPAVKYKDIACKIYRDSP